MKKILAAILILTLVAASAAAALAVESDETVNPALPPESIRRRITLQ